MGFPSPALDYQEERISLDKTIIDHPNSTFFMQMEGNSMISAFIPPKSLLVVDRSLTAQNGDIIVAVVQGEFLVRFLKKNDFKIWLCPANSKLQDLLITPELEMSVWGVVIRIVINPKLAPYVRPR